MRILYFGTVCEISEYEKIISNCKTKPSIAPIVFESALLEGMKSNGVDVTVYSFPMIPTFPDSNILGWGRKRQHLKCEYVCTWMRTINLPVIKQISRQLDGKKILKNWIKNNYDNDCVILLYSIPPFLVKDVLYYGNKYNIPCCAIIADLPRDMYMNQTELGVKGWLKKKYLNRTLQLQGMFDGYIYLTKAMSNVINPKRPYIVMEGIADITFAMKEYKKTFQNQLAVMYAGGLYEKYGVLNLIDAFEALDRDDTELWIFGDGTAREAIIERAKNNPKICYYGQKSRETVLEYEKKADILVNPRNPMEEYTKYSFPSKTIEYMLSGTPLLTTRLAGIPKEYYPFLFIIEENSVECLSKALDDILELPQEVRLKKGLVAKEFIIEQKNSSMQAKRILKFIKEIVSK